MKFLIPFFAAGALAFTPSVVQRDAAGAATASAALSRVIAANRALETAINEFVPPDSDASANAVLDVYNAITDGTTAINGIEPLTLDEALGLSGFVPQLTDSTSDSVDATINAKDRLVEVCLGTFTFQVFGELQPLAQAFADALESKVPDAVKPVVASTGDQVQTDLRRGEAAFADQSPPPCQCGGDCGTSTTTTTTTSETTTTTSETTTTTSETTTTTSESTTTTSESTTETTETTTTTSGTVSGGWEGWGVITSTTTKAPEYTTTKAPEYTTTKAPEYTTTKAPEYTTSKAPEYTTSKAPEYTTSKAPGGGEYTTSKAPAASSTWEVVTSKAPEYTTSKAPAGGNTWEAITTKAPGGGSYTTTKAPVASYTTTKAPIATYAGAAAAGAVMNVGAIILAAGAALL